MIMNLGGADQSINEPPAQKPQREERHEEKHENKEDKHEPKGPRHDTSPAPKRKW